MFLPVLLVGISVGCTPTYVNLTPNRAPREANDQYRFEVQWHTRRSGANNPGVKAYVVIDQGLYPMTRIPNTDGRFEGYAPVGTERSVVPYRFKFDYDYPGLPQRVPSSDWSPECRLNLPQN